MDPPRKLINGRPARFFNFKERECYPPEIIKQPSRWKLIFNGEDWSHRKVFYADEVGGTIIQYAVDKDGKHYKTEDGEIAQSPPKKGRVRILKMGEEIDTVERIHGIYRED